MRSNPNSVSMSFVYLTVCLECSTPSNGSLIYHGAGAKCGSTYIDRNFHELMTDRFGEAYTSVSEANRGPGSTFMGDFEIAKKDFGSGHDEHTISLRMDDAPDSEYYDSDERRVILTR
jgi:hypothetical protein